MQSHFSRDGPAPTSSSSIADSRPAGLRAGEGADSVLHSPGGDAGARPKPTPVSGAHGKTATRAARHSTQALGGPRKVGKYLVSPLVKASENGWFISSVSIRSGTGSGTTDRVLRLTRLFRCAKEATTYAHAEALQWISTPPFQSLAA
jgi:hypothetical protein